FLSAIKGNSFPCAVSSLLSRSPTGCENPGFPHVQIAISLRRRWQILCNSSRVGTPTAVGSGRRVLLDNGGVCDGTNPIDPSPGGDSDDAAHDDRRRDALATPAERGQLARLARETEARVCDDPRREHPSVRAGSWPARRFGHDREFRARW